jgi:hypothetical protein
LKHQISSVLDPGLIGYENAELKIVKKDHEKRRFYIIKAKPSVIDLEMIE